MFPFQLCGNCRWCFVSKKIRINEKITKVHGYNNWSLASSTNIIFRENAGCHSELKSWSSSHLQHLWWKLFIPVICQHHKMRKSFGISKGTYYIMDKLSIHSWTHTSYAFRLKDRKWMCKVDTQAAAQEKKPAKDSSLFTCKGKKPFVTLKESLLRLEDSDWLP